jgi:hypothetical protein
MIINVKTFFTRLFEELGYVKDSEINGLFIRFNRGVTIVPQKYIGESAFKYCFPDTRRNINLTWRFDATEDLRVDRISYRVTSRIVKNHDSNDVFIDLVSVIHDD